MPPTLLKQDAQYQNPLGTDMHNQQTFSDPVACKVRFEQGYKTIVSATGEQQQIAGTVFMKASESIAIGAKVTYAGDVYRVLIASKMAGRNGQIDHLEVMVQSWNY